MEVLTITCHDVYNAGASLQAYALMKYLENEGHNVTIINYKPDYLCHHYTFLDVPNKKYDVIPLKYMYILLKLPERLREYFSGRKQNFDKFRINHLKVGTKVYKDNEQLKKDCPDGDIVIAGSDQIWNPLFQNGKDKAFYLDFVPSGMKKVSYAASMVVKELDQRQRVFVKELLQDFTMISVREKSAANILHDLGLKVKTVMDPVFLLSKPEWEKMILENDKEPSLCGKPYILLYDFEGNESVRVFAKKVSERYDLDIISFFDSKDKKIRAAGPIQFLKLIREADCVLSNSFHATAFSIIFEKDFYVFNREENLNSRMQELLEMLNLSERMLSSENAEINNKKVEYKKVNLILEKKIEESKQFLGTAIM